MIRGADREGHVQQLLLPAKQEVYAGLSQCKMLLLSFRARMLHATVGSGPLSYLFWI